MTLPVETNMSSIVMLDVDPLPTLHQPHQTERGYRHIHIAQQNIPGHTFPQPFPLPVSLLPPTQFPSFPSPVGHYTPPFPLLPHSLFQERIPVHRRENSE